MGDRYGHSPCWKLFAICSGMVGDPKDLSDLARIEAQLRVTCERCGAAELWDLNDAIAHVRAAGGNTDWRAARLSFDCPTGSCLRPAIRLLPIPYGKGPTRKRRPARRVLLNLALTILRDAAQRSAQGRVDTIEVRLALRVTAMFIEKRELLTGYWEAAAIDDRRAWTNCHLPYRWIAQALIDQGLPVDRENRP